MMFHQDAIREDGGSRAVSGESSTVQEQRSRTAIENQIEIVSCYKLRSRKHADHADQFTAAARVEEHTRFIEEEHCWPHGQHARQCGAAFFTARKMKRNSLTRIPQTDGHQCLSGTRRGFRRSRTHVQRPKGDIFLHGWAKQLLVGVLEYHSDQFGQLLSVLGNSRVESTHRRLPWSPPEYTTQPKE
jgi:hypothetical protein